MRNIRIEVKGKGGRFVPFAKDVPIDLTPVNGARWYLEQVSRADYVAMPYIVRGNSRTNAHNGRVHVAVYEKAQVLRALDKVERGERGALKVISGQVKVMAIEAGRMNMTFGRPVALHSTNLTKWDDIEPDAGCANAPYARAWEKICAKAVNGQWVGALRGVQVDVIINPNDD